MGMIDTRVKTRGGSRIAVTAGKAHRKPCIPKSHSSTIHILPSPAINPSKQPMIASVHKEKLSINVPWHQCRTVNPSPKALALSPGRLKHKVSTSPISPKLTEKIPALSQSRCYWCRVYFQYGEVLNVYS